MGTTSQAGNLASQLGGSALGSIVGEGMGLLFAGANNANQLQQQGALDAQQLGYTEQDQAYQQQLQMQTWQQTNYPAQVQQLEEAGLNPALIYGMHGGGGTTTGSIGGGGVSGAAAPSTSIGQTAQMAIQSAATQSEINLNNAQAAKIQAETPGAPGLQSAQTNQANAAAANLTAGVQNQQAQATLTQIQTQISQVQQQIQNQTIPDQVATIRAAATQAENTAQQAVRNNSMDQQTMNDKIQQVHAILLGQMITNSLNQSNIKVNQEQIQQMANQIIQSRYQTAINTTNMNTADAQQQTNEGLLQLQKTLQSYNMLQKPVDDLMNGIRTILPSFHIGTNTSTHTNTP